MAAAQVPAALEAPPAPAPRPWSLQTQAVGTTPVVPPGGPAVAGRASPGPLEKVYPGLLWGLE